MFIRSAFLLVLFCSITQGQVEEVQGPDVMKWAMIARNATNHAEFGLTAKQYHGIKVADIEFQNSVIAAGERGLSPQEREEKCKAYLSRVTDTLAPEQQQRLRQVMFQIWMNRDNLAVPLETFAPEAIELSLIHI